MPLDADIENKISAARTQLILDKPFLGALVLRLPLKAADPSWCATAATDMKTLYINTDYIAQLKPAEVQFVLAKQALHCALSHFSRRMHRIRHLWELACDYAINPILVREGLIPPPDVRVMWSYEGMSAEEIYPLLSELENEGQAELGQNNQTGDQEQGESADQGEPKNTREQKLNNSPQDYGENGSGQTNQQNDSPLQPDQQTSGNTDIQKQPPPKLNNDEVQNLTTQWQQRLAGAAQQALQAGKLSQAMMRLVDHLLQPQLPWRMLLARYMTASAREDYSYARPSNRRGDPAIYPRLRSQKLTIVTAIDVSGSIATSELQEFLSEINQIKAQIRAEITLIACDAIIDADGPWHYQPWDNFELPKSFSGGGGTDFRPVFDWVQTREITPDMLVYFTDAEGQFPEQAPQYPVIWLVKGKHAVPWGQRIQLN